MKIIRGKITRTAALFALAAGSMLPCSRGADDGRFLFPTTGIGVRGQAMLLAIDEYLLPLRENLTCYVSTPTYRAQPVLVPDKDNPLAPDQVAAQFYGSVLYEGGKFRMWYYGIHLIKPGDAYRPNRANLFTGPTCYAESNDGITWRKPKLGQVEIGGSKENNAILLPDDRPQGAYIIRDDDDPDPRRRYKIFYERVLGTRRNPHTCGVAISPDGLHWQAAPGDSPEIWMEPGGFYKFNGQYTAIGHNGDSRDGPEPGYSGPYVGSGRQAKAQLSPDFIHWVRADAAAFQLPEPADPAKRGFYEPYDQIHIGVGGAPFGNVVVGLYGLWHNVKGENVNDRSGENAWFGRGTTSCDLGLVISNDGLHFREPVIGRVFISRHDTPVTQLPGKPYPTILLQSGNGILNVGNETRIYHGRWLNGENNQGYSGEVALATLPRDRWGGLGLYPKQAEFYKKSGTVWSAPVRLPAAGGEIVLNADGADSMSVEIADENFQLLPEYSGQRRARLATSAGLDCRANWPGQDIARLGGRTIRVKVNVEERADGTSPRLYAIYLRSK